MGCMVQRESLIVFFCWLVQSLNWGLDRALDYYYQRPDWWRNLVRKSMQIDFSWDVSAEQYVDLYKQVLAKARARQVSYPTNLYDRLATVKYLLGANLTSCYPFFFGLYVVIFHCHSTILVVSFLGKILVPVLAGPNFSTELSTVPSIFCHCCEIGWKFYVLHSMHVSFLFLFVLNYHSIFCFGKASLESCEFVFVQTR